MRMEFRRLTGAPVGTLDWSGITATPDEWRVHAREALMGFYDFTEHSFWPNVKVASIAAEEVRIVADDGSVLASYSIKDVIKETGKSLSGILG